jgi:hypothetical protein
MRKYSLYSRKFERHTLFVPYVHPCLMPQLHSPSVSLNKSWIKTEILEGVGWCTASGMSLLRTVRRDVEENLLLKSWFARKVGRWTSFMIRTSSLWRRVVSSRVTNISEERSSVLRFVLNTSVRKLEISGASKQGRFVVFVALPFHDQPNFP